MTYFNNLGQARVGWRIPSGGGTPSIITNGLILNLDASNASSYPGQGTVWTNTIGNNYNGVLSSGIGYTTNYGGGLTLDGISNYVLLSGTNKPNTPTTNSGFSFGMWFNINSWSAAKGIFQITYPNSLTSTTPYVLLNTLNTNQIQYYVDNSWRSLGSTLTNRNAPQYISFTISINQFGFSVWKTYLNGVLQGTLNLTGPITRLNTSDVYLGNGFNGFTFMNCYSTHMYNRTLSDAEVLQNFNNTKTRFGL